MLRLDIGVKVLARLVIIGTLAFLGLADVSSAATEPLCCATKRKACAPKSFAYRRWSQGLPL